MNFAPMAQFSLSQDFFVQQLDAVIDRHATLSKICPEGQIAVVILSPESYIEGENVFVVDQPNLDDLSSFKEEGATHAFVGFMDAKDFSDLDEWDGF